MVVSFIATYSQEEVLALAPDASSVKSGKELSSERKWQNLGSDGSAIWGECQGSGANPYKASIDLNGPAFKCSCPSRKFPCKHGLGLLLLAMGNAAVLAAESPPEWVSTWLETRGDRAAKKKEREEKPRTEEDLIKLQGAKEKRRADRFEKIEAGVDELTVFLTDLIRQGTGSLKNKPYSFWKERAARLVDAQAPGLAKRLLDAGSGGGADYQEKLLLNLGQIYLLARAFQQREHLSDELKEDIFTEIGLNQSQEEVLAKAGIFDTWAVVGQYFITEEKLRIQKTYLVGENTGVQGLVLAFAHGTMAFNQTLVPGKSYDGHLNHFPARYPQRALLKEQGAPKPIDTAKLKSVASATIGSAGQEWGRVLALDPFVLSMPVFFRDCRIFHLDGAWWLKDSDNNHYPVKADNLDCWQLFAFSSGKPFTIFGEWYVDHFMPLSALCQDVFLRVAVRQTKRELLEASPV